MYELMIVPVLSGLTFPEGVNDWRHGDQIDAPAQIAAGLPPRDKPLPKCFRSLAPVFADDVVALLRSKGADNLQVVPLTVGGYAVVNVVGRISIASFFASLPAAETFGSRKDKVAQDMRDVASLVKKLAAKATPPPPLVIARLAEANHPLLVRSDVARELEAMKCGAKFDDVRFCDMYIGSGFYNVVADAL